MPTTATKERPIILHDWEVLAILDKRKSHLRRVANPLCAEVDRNFILVDGAVWVEIDHEQLCHDDYDKTIYGGDVIYPNGEWTPFVKIVVGGGDGRECRCPYGKPGDRLWVRETWVPVSTFDPSPETGALYRADPMYDGTTEFDWKWRPSIHMPRWASRITLEVTEVRVERLQDISEEDAKAEGVNGGCLKCGQENPCGCGVPSPCHLDSFVYVWNEINAKRGYPWESNPWVWVVGFQAVE